MSKQTTKKIEPIDRYLIEKAENDSRMEGNNDLVIFVQTTGKALNLIMDKLDEIVEHINKEGKHE